jgi:aspartate kinase
MKVLKFGGSCLKEGESMLQVGEIITSDPSPKAVVVSAVNNVTDSLVAFMSELRTEQEVQEFIRELRDTHMALLRDVAKDMETKQMAVSMLLERLTRLERLLYGICYLEELTPRTRDLVQSFGEQMSVILVSAMLQDMGVNAVPLMADEIGIITDGNYGSATADLAATRENIGARIREMVGRAEVPVITGFFGRTEEGHITIFGRNGTDYSAAVIGNAIQADSIEIWKDVDGFMSADPRVVQGAVSIKELSYEEAAELSYFGAQVLHPRTVEPAREADIPIRLMNVFRPECEGTLIHSSSGVTPNTIKSVSCMREMAVIKAYGAGIGYRFGVLSALTSALKDAEVNIYSVATSQTCVSLLVDRKDLPQATEWLIRMPKALVDRVEVAENLALICVVGEGLGYREGVAARVFDAVARARVNIGMISAGASMVAYCFTVDKKDLEATTRAIHKDFFGD